MTVIIHNYTLNMNTISNADILNGKKNICKASLQSWNNNSNSDTSPASNDKRYKENNNNDEPKNDTLEQRKLLNNHLKGKIRPHRTLQMISKIWGMDLRMTRIYMF